MVQLVRVRIGPVGEGEELSIATLLPHRSSVQGSPCSSQ